MGDLLDEILQEMELEGIKGSLSTPSLDRMKQKERDQKKASIKKEAFMRLIQAAKSILETNPYVGPADCCIHCGRLKFDGHTDDCKWLHLKREILSYENKYPTKPRGPVGEK